MKVKEIISCSFPSWFEKFKAVTTESIILPLPMDVLSYLLDNGTLVLPDENKIIQDDDTIEEVIDNNVPVMIAPQLTEFSKQIKVAIGSLGGSIFPKLNWSSPKDASWISFNKSLQCFNSSDIYLLLKSSDFVTHDLISPFENCEDAEEFIDMDHQYCLVLRKWVEINPSEEFRCFVKNKMLIGISQRDITQHYSSIKKEKDEIIFDIIEFWEENICDLFNLESYVFDVHRKDKANVTLIDFNPFGVTTDCLMFSWEELMCNKTLQGSFNKVSLDKITIFGEGDLDSNKESVTSEWDVDPEFRYVSNETGVQPSPYMQYGLPADIIDLSLRPQLGDFAQLMKAKMEAENVESSSDEDVELSSKHLSS